MHEENPDVPRPFSKQDWVGPDLPLNWYEGLSAFAAEQGL